MSGVIEAIDNALHDWETSPDAMRWTPNAANVTPRMPPLLTFNFDARPLQRAFEKMAAAVAQMAIAAKPILARITHSLPDHDRVRCQRCSPMANPPTLCINGHEYRRRSKRR
jgi:hypothetical protein